MAAELAAAEARLASSQDVAHLRTAGECWRLIVVVRSAATTSAFLCQCCRPMQPHICQRRRQYEMWNTELCISAAMRHALGVARGVADVLQGGCAADPVQFGMTTDEERSACRPAAQVANLIYSPRVSHWLTSTASAVAALPGSGHVTALRLAGACKPRVDCIVCIIVQNRLHKTALSDLMLLSSICSTKTEGRAV